MTGAIPTQARSAAADVVRDALDNARLGVWYQPKVDLATGRIAGVEALLRVRTPEGAVQGPAEVLHAADESGMMSEITAHVLAAAVADCAAWFSAGVIVPVAVNVTPDDLSSSSLPAQVSALLDCHGLPGDMLSLEVTETAMLQNPERSTEVMQQLHRIGVTFSADDFGVGYSCLSRLVQLPLTELKIDLGLVLGMHTSRHGQAAVRAVIDLGHALGLRVLAEGVEDERTLRELREARCDLAQGYLFSPAIPADALVDWARSYHQHQHQHPSGRQFPAAAMSFKARERRGTVVRRLIDGIGLPLLSIYVFALATYLAWQGVRWGGAEHQAVIGDLAFVPVNGAAVVGALSAARARHATRRARRGWLWLAGALVSYLLGNVLQLVYELAHPGLPLGTVSDVPYLMFYPLCLMGLLQFLQPIELVSHRIRHGLDIAIMAISCATVLWFVYLRPVTEHHSGWSLDVAVAVAYPVGDIVLLFGVVTVFLRGFDNGLAHPLRMLVTGFLAYLVSDIWYGHIQLAGHYRGGDLVDTGWMVALATLGLAGAMYARSSDVDRRTSEAAEPWSWWATASRLPYLALAGVYGLLLYSSHTVPWNPLGGLIAAATSATLLVAARQVLAQQDNLHLLERSHILAASDDLTELPNRRRLLELARAAFVMARHHGVHEDLPVSTLLVIDVDHFRQINNRFGHESGDAVLRTVAEACRTRLRPTDIVGRYGADEFVAVLPNTTAAQAEPVVLRLRERMSTLLDEAGIGHIPATLSIGLAESTECRTLDDMLTRADRALHAAKSGRRTEVHAPGSTR